MEDNKKEIKSMTKKEREIFVNHYIAKNNKLIHGQFLTYGLKGEKEIMLTYRLSNDSIKSIKVRNGDRLSLPYGYVKYLNTHGSVRREVSAGMMHTGEDDFTQMPIKVEEDEKRYEFRVLDVLSASDLEEIEPSVLFKASLDDRRL